MVLLIELKQCVAMNGFSVSSTYTSFFNSVATTGVLQATITWKVNNLSMHVHIHVVPSILPAARVFLPNKLWKKVNNSATKATKWARGPMPLRVCVPKNMCLKQWKWSITHYLVLETWAAHMQQLLLLVDSFLSAQRPVTWTQTGAHN